MSLLTLKGTRIAQNLNIPMAEHPSGERARLIPSQTGEILFQDSPLISRRKPATLFQACHYTW